MNPHFFTAPFFFAFIWFRVQEIVSYVTSCFSLREKCRRQYVQANWIFRSVATLKSSETPFRAQRDGEPKTFCRLT